MLTVAEDVVTNPWSLKKAVASRLCSQLYIFFPFNERLVLQSFYTLHFTL
jgi:hypothetical protein